MKADYFWINGELVPSKHALPDLLDRGAEAGLSLVKDFRCYETDTGPAVFRLEEHIRQFLKAARSKGFEVQLNVEDFCERVHRTLMFNGIRDGRIRLLLLNGDAGDRHRADPANGRSANILAIGIWKAGRPREAERDRVPLREGLVLGNQVPEDAAMFLVLVGKLLTPQSKTFGNALVRISIITLANDLGFEVQERPLTRAHIAAAGEMFLVTVNGEIAFVREFDSQPIGNGSLGPVTHALQTIFYQTVQGRGKRSREWLDWVGGTNIGI